MSTVDIERAFEILEIPAAGAYGTVCLARVVGEQRVVALKVLRTDHVGRKRIAARTRDEARMLMRLSHPNIVRVERLLQLAGRPVLVMEWVEGATLARLLHEGPEFPAPVAMEVIRRAASGLDYAFAKATGEDGQPLRIVHRDIKPSNVLLSVDGEVKVVDFGVARGEFDDREISTTTTHVLGSQGYIAPERLTGALDTPAVDVYALGVTLFELVGRQPLVIPLQPEQHTAALAAMLARWSVDGVPDDLMAALRSLVARTCHTDRDARPTTGQLCDELAALAVAYPADLPAFAAERIRPVVEARVRIPPQAHPDWNELAFLEKPWDILTASPQGDRDPEADRKVRLFLARPSWERHASDLYWLLATQSDWTEAPFLELLDVAWPPWWRFWAQPTPKGQVLIALKMLRHRAGPEVLKRAQRYRHHPDPDVARAAHHLLTTR